MEFSCTNTFSISSCKVTLSKTIPSSLLNLPVLTLSFQESVSRRPGKSAAIKQIRVCILSRVQIMFSASWRLTMPSDEITNPWIPVLLFHDMLRWSWASTKDFFCHGMPLQGKGFVRIQIWMQDYRHWRLQTQYSRNCHEMLNPSLAVFTSQVCSVRLWLLDFKMRIYVWYEVCALIFNW